MAAAAVMPSKMTALYYEKARHFSVIQADLPSIDENEVLLKVSMCGVCGTDQHIHEGEFISKFPLIPGHEVIGTIVQAGSKVHSVSIGDRVVCDVGETCGKCFYCQRGTSLFVLLPFKTSFLFSQMSRCSLIDQLYISFHFHRLGLSGFVRVSKPMG
ncbi:N-terminal acetyltransferase A complex catalytic subunit ard1 [Puccinia graminis f. sp. tritici]|uniref:N-terminal acetyltransferase A complex catalytic subunit ard1 n=1 Tax=Puccinia graminis f. sp. tritici TaxID=56615 RepID=A0A5B0NEG5_PUCGR|nr:N-terminal acetyltransferase A complex catalytic subunit ard1 [Puccinia graminis f. sp. tritici]